MSNSQLDPKLEQTLKALAGAGSNAQIKNIGGNLYEVYDPNTGKSSVYRVDQKGYWTYEGGKMNYVFTGDYDITHIVSTYDVKKDASGNVTMKASAERTQATVNPTTGDVTVRTPVTSGGSTVGWIQQSYKIVEQERPLAQEEAKTIAEQIKSQNPDITNIRFQNGSMLITQKVGTLGGNINPELVKKELERQLAEQGFKGTALYKPIAGGYEFYVSYEYSPKIKETFFKPVGDIKYTHFLDEETLKQIPEPIRSKYLTGPGKSALEVSGSSIEELMFGFNKKAQSLIEETNRYYFEKWLESLPKYGYSSEQKEIGMSYSPKEKELANTLFAKSDIIYGVMKPAPERTPNFFEKWGASIKQAFEESYYSFKDQGLLGQFGGAVAGGLNAFAETLAYPIKQAIYSAEYGIKKYLLRESGMEKWDLGRYLEYKSGIEHYDRPFTETTRFLSSGIISEGIGALAKQITTVTKTTEPFFSNKNFMFSLKVTTEFKLGPIKLPFKIEESVFASVLENTKKVSTLFVQTSKNLQAVVRTTEKENNIFAQIFSKDIKDLFKGINLMKISQKIELPNLKGVVLENAFPRLSKDSTIIVEQVKEARLMFRKGFLIGEQTGKRIDFEIAEIKVGNNRFIRSAVKDPFAKTVEVEGSIGRTGKIEELATGAISAIRQQRVINLFEKIGGTIKFSNIANQISEIIEKARPKLIDTEKEIPFIGRSIASKELIKMPNITLENIKIPTSTKLSLRQLPELKTINYAKYKEPKINTEQNVKIPTIPRLTNLSLPSYTTPPSLPLFPNLKLPKFKMNLDIDIDLKKPKEKLLDIEGSSKKLWQATFSFSQVKSFGEILKVKSPKNIEIGFTGLMFKNNKNIRLL